MCVTSYSFKSTKRKIVNSQLLAPCKCLYIAALAVAQWDLSAAVQPTVNVPASGVEVPLTH